MIISLADNFDWDAVVGALQYELELRNASTGGLARSLEVPTASVDAETLMVNQPPGPYTLKVRAETGAIEGEWSDSLVFDFLPLTKVGNLRIRV